MLSRLGQQGGWVGDLQGRASHLGSTGLGLSQRQRLTREMPAIRKDGMAATKAMLSSLAFRIWSISSMALSVSTFSFCTYTDMREIQDTVLV